MLNGGSTGVLRQTAVSHVVVPPARVLRPVLLSTSTGLLFVSYFFYCCQAFVCFWCLLFFLCAVYFTVCGVPYVSLARGVANQQKRRLVLPSTRCETR